VTLAQPPHLTATAGRPARGPTRYATASAAACAPLSSPRVTARSGSGARCARCSPRRASNAAGSTRSPTCSPPCPRSAHPGAKKALAEIWNAEDRANARRAAAAFKLAYVAKFPEAVAKITDDMDERPRFYDYPAEHWIRLRTTNPIESTFATVRNRSKITKGPGLKACAGD